MWSIHYIKNSCLLLFGIAVVTINLFAYRATEKTTATFRDALHEHEKYAVELENLLQEKEEQQKALISAIEELEVSVQKTEKLVGDLKALQAKFVDGVVNEEIDFMFIVTGAMGLIKQEKALLEFFDQEYKQEILGYIQSVKKFRAAILGYKMEVEEGSAWSRVRKLEKAAHQAVTEANIFISQLETRIRTRAKSKLNNEIQRMSQLRQKPTFKAVEVGRQKILIVLNVLLGLLGMLMIFVMVAMIMRPIRKVANAATKIAVGDIDQIVDHHSGDEIGVLADAFRSLIDYIKGLANAAAALSRGDLAVQVIPKSHHDVLSKNFSQVADTLRAVIAETGQLVEAAKAGQLDHRGEATKFQGGYREVVQGINEMLDAVIAPIHEAATVLERVANRDLAVRMHGAYQGDFATIKQAMNTAVGNLDASMMQVAAGADQVASAAGQINTGSQTLAQGASEQASTLQEISSSLQELASMSQHNATNAQEARSLSSDAHGSADRGISSMERLSQAIDAIKTASDETAKIVKTIDEIAFQTNLLALNAAVEAARAGDAGKGFAVVADEVRSLAIRSAEAAKNTAQLIDEAVHKAEDGVELNREALTNLEDITTRVRQVNEVIGKIATASDHQQQGVGQLKTAVEQLNQVTQQTAANSEESASASEELSSQADMMRNIVTTFQLTAANNPSFLDDARLSSSMNSTVPTLSQFPPQQIVGGGRNDDGNDITHRMPEEVIPLDDEDTQILRDF